MEKYLHLTATTVEKRIARELPENFAVMVDGWTTGSTHFLGVVACYPCPCKDYETALLAFSPLLDETSQSAEEQYDFIAVTLNNFEKNIADNVVALIADNCEINKALARLCEVPLIISHSHRLDLAAKEYLKPHDKLISKVNALMGKLKTPKIAAEVRKHSPFCPIQIGITKWRSVMQMFERYLVLKEHIVQIKGVLQLLLSLRRTTK